MRCASTWQFSSRNTVTGTVKPKPRQDNLLTYLWVTLGVLLLVAGGLALSFMMKKSASDAAVSRLNELASQLPDPPVGTPQEVTMLVGFLNSNTPTTALTAKAVLQDLMDENNGVTNINDAILEALRNSKNASAQEDLITIIQHRNVRGEEAEKLLVTMTGPLNV